MRKKAIFTLLVICLIFAGTYIFFTYKTSDKLLELQADEVESIYLYRLDSGNEEIQDIETFVGYYNQIYDVVEDKEAVGSVATCILTIVLKSGETIYLYNYSDDFAIIANGNQLWGKQLNICNLLWYGRY